MLPPGCDAVDPGEHQARQRQRGGSVEIPAGQDAAWLVDLLQRLA
jgi:hypothetical protein